VTVFQIVATAFLGTVATGRITRLAVNDEFPPVVWARMKWDHLTHDGSWSALAHCMWCFSPYAAAGVFGLGYFLEWPTWWYVVTGWLTASYLAAILVFHDEGKS
jgi:hypothetical protein